MIEFYANFYNRTASPKTIVARLDKLFNEPQALNLQFRANIDYAIKKLSKL